MDYLDLLSDPRVADDDWHPVYEMLDDHRVARFLRARGYDFLQFGSWWVGTHDNPVADEDHPLGFSEFTKHYLQGTILRPLFGCLPDPSFTMRLDWDHGQCQRVARQVETIKDDRPARPASLCLHPLHSAARSLRLRARRAVPDPGESPSRGGHLQGYVEQVAYASRMIEHLVTALQAEGRPHPVILIQADEGPFSPRARFRTRARFPGGTNDPMAGRRPEKLQDQVRNPQRLLFPRRRLWQFRPDITPVNSYRVLFNRFFGADFPLLPDRIYAHPFKTNLFEFHDVTSIVRGETGAAAHRSAP